MANRHPSVNLDAAPRRGGGTPAAGGLPDFNLDGGSLPAFNLDHGKGGGRGTEPAPGQHHGHHGLLGGLESAGHWIGDKTDRAARDIKSIPGGLVDLGRLEYGAIKYDVQHPNLGHHESLHDFLHGSRNPSSHRLGQAEVGMVRQAVTSLEHPGRDPFQTVMTVLPVYGALGKAADLGSLGRISAADRALEVNGERVPLYASKNPATKAVQLAHDRVVQHAMDTNPEGRLGRYGAKRVGGSLEETARARARLRDVPATLLDKAAHKLTRTPMKQGSRAEQAALELTSVNTAPEDAAAYHAAKAAEQGRLVDELRAKPELRPHEKRALAEAIKAAPRNVALSKLYGKVAAKGWLTRNGHGDVIVDAARHPKLAQTDVRLATVQGKGDEVLAKYGVRTADQLGTRVDAPARIRAGGHYVTPSEARSGANDVKAMGDAMEQTAEREAAAAVRAARQRAREFGSGADRAEAKAFAVGTRRTAAEREVLAESKRANLAAERASKQRFDSAPRAAEGEKAAALLHREQRLAQITYERFQRGEVGPGVVDRAQRRLAAISDRYEKNAGAVVAMRAATGIGKESAKAQEMHIARLRVAEQDAAKAHEAATAEAAALRGRSVGAAYRADYLKKLGAIKTEKVRAATERAVAEELDRANKLLGGNAARPGRGFVSYRTAEPRRPKGSAASAQGPVVGEPRSPITKQVFTGGGIQHGLVPNDVSGAAGRHFSQIMRFVNTSEHRLQAIKTGSDARQTSRDVLVRVPGTAAEKIPAAVNEILGKGRLTTDDIDGLNAALQEFKADLVPGLRDRFARDRNVGIGTKAPDGYVWVDRNVLGDLAKPGQGPRGGLVRSLDNINSAVTAATVYFKIGHVATRVLTNATTNIIQGSAAPLEIAKSVNLWHGIDDVDKARALAASGQHGFVAMPHEGVSMAARVAGHGARWWAKHADAPFRFNSIAYEARKAGFDTPERFHSFLDKLENPQGLNAAQTAKVDWVAKRANREAIAYDRLSEAERRYLTRAMWFYPWVKGTMQFALNTAAEHPFKAGVLGAVGVHGREQQQKDLGDVPSYVGGLFKIGGSSAKPTVADFSTFSPFATPADVIQELGKPYQLSDQLTPALAAATHLGFGLDQYGNPTPHPVTGALATLVSPTPEAQIVTGYLGRKKPQDRRMFPASRKAGGTLSPVMRALVGPGMPRPFNPQAAHSAAARERSGRR